MTIPMILTLSFLFTRLSHPLSLGATLLLQTVIMSLTVGISTYSFWFSYILFMIFLGGMLVLFIYVASLASNEIFSFSLLTFLAYSMFLLFLSLSFLFIDPLIVPNFSSIPLSTINNSTSTPFIVSWIYNSPSMWFTLFLISYLLLTLIVIVKIINLFKGPLRLSN
uniref:NADH-ubiquinone oxidoreductase chain 6 n=1 Tax=Atergatis floridus TaxID=373434 RepID=A0A343UMB9_9EUCA|nr:NADH dehydrogenase subunit 6 [Atergatis floridus]AVE15419.1 NADH dehydrogenase subunit 6 [Atergatis floridus]